MIRFYLVVLLMPLCASAKDLYDIRDLSEKKMVQTYNHVLLDACHHADSDWKTSAFDSNAGYWGDGVSDGNEGIRTIVSMALASSTLLKYDDQLSEIDRKELLQKTTAAIRFATATHRSGPQKCMDGKQWGATAKFGPGSWQSGMWTGTLAFGAWLIWDKLDPSVQQGVQNVVAWEDDILSKRPPPNGLWLDTKAEENGWEVPALVLGELMFPHHPHASAWHETALKYMMNTLCTAEDMHDTNMVDGRAVKDWVTGANLQPDFTLENHNIFHPSYVGCSSYFLTQAQMYYTYANRPIPQAASHHLIDTWRMFQTIILPTGESAYPQGMDWELHGLPFINLFASLATHWKDPVAARMEQQSLQYIRAWQVMRQGDMAIPGSRLGITRHAICAEQAAYGLLAHKVFGPATKEATAHAVATMEQGVHEHPYIQFITDRTQNKFASFSWKNRIMGQIIPLWEKNGPDPFFTVPIPNSLIGSFELFPRGNIKTSVVEHSWKKSPDGFETTGTLLLNGGRLKQTLTMISLGERTVVYADRVTALSNITVRTELGVPIGIENDEISGGTRVVSSQSGRTIFDWQKPRPPVAIPGSWVNVDGGIGIVALAGSGLNYAPAAGYSPGISVCSDILYGSSSDHTKTFKAGDEVARRIVLFFTEITPRETESLAQSCKIESNHDGEILHFKPAGEKEAEVRLP